MSQMRGTGLVRRLCGDAGVGDPNKAYKESKVGGGDDGERPCGRHFRFGSLLSIRAWKIIVPH